MRNQDKNNGLNMTTVLLLALTVGGGFLLFRNSIKAKNAEEQQKFLVDDEPTRIASQIKYFMGGFLQRPNVDAIISLARTIKDWPAVVSAYSRLYGGENLEETIRTSLQKWGGYQEFLLAISKKGLPGSNTDNLVAQPKDVTLKKGDRIIIDDSTWDVVYYKNWQDYPTKELVRIPKGRFNPAAKTVTFLQAYEAQYAGSAVKTLLYQIQLSNGSIVWVNRNRNIMKRTVKGLGAINNIV
jgi:hypothetical protein